MDCLLKLTVTNYGGGIKKKTPTPHIQLHEEKSAEGTEGQVLFSFLFSQSELRRFVDFQRFALRIFKRASATVGKSEICSAECTYVEALPPLNDIRSG